MESTMSVVMKGVSDALRLDGNNKPEEAYIKYLECVLRLTTKLLQDTRKEGGHVQVTTEVVRFVRLGQQCMDRISAIINQLGGSQKSKNATTKLSASQNQPDLIQSTGSYQQGTKSAPCTPTDATKATVTMDTRGRLYSAPVPALPESDTSSLYKRHKSMSPMELAFKQNQQLMKAYKARLDQMGSKRLQATNLSLTIQRKMAENLAIAKAQEEALQKKMKERQTRLEEQAARKFNSPSGMSDEELEQKETYKKVLEYEQDMKWISDLRSQLEENPSDDTLIDQLVQGIFRCVDHPLTEKLKQYQIKIYQQIYPLVSTKMDRVNQIQVPLSEDLFPKFEKLEEISENMDKDSSDDLAGSETEKSKVEEKNNVETSTSKGDNSLGTKVSVKGDESCDNSNLEDENVADRCESEFSKDHEESEVGVDKDQVLFRKKDKIEESEIHETVKQEEDTETKRSDAMSGIRLSSISDKIGDSDYETCVEEEKEDKESDEELTVKTLEEVTRDVAEDLEKAIEMGDKVTKNLKKESENSEKIISHISQKIDKYSEESMDDLLDEIMEDDEDNESEADLSKSEQNTVINQSNDSKETKDSEKCSQSGNMNLKESKEMTDSKKSSQSDKSKRNSNSSKEELTSKPQVPNVLALDSSIVKMKNEAYCRHLKSIASDIHYYLDKLMALFIVSYEQLDTPDGRDYLCSCLEEPFFKPMWPYLLSLFRLSNETEEIHLAYVMTKKSQCIPTDFGVTEKLSLPDLHTSKENYPYSDAVYQLQSVSKQTTLLDKLQCLVKSFRVVCQCVEDYYQKEVDSGKIHKIPSIGADDLLPILCYIIIRTKLPQIISECQIMEEFVHEGYIIGEEGYCLTSMQTAVGYLLNMKS